MLFGLMHLTYCTVVPVIVCVYVCVCDRVCVYVCKGTVSDNMTENDDLVGKFEGVYNMKMKCV